MHYSFSVDRDGFDLVAEPFEHRLCCMHRMMFCRAQQHPISAQSILGEGGSDDPRIHRFGAGRREEDFSEQASDGATYYFPGTINCGFSLTPLEVE